jgi:hypothetical protein
MITRKQEGLTMKMSLITPAGLASLLIGATVFCTGCESKGPAERAGENIDQGVQNVKDTISPPGPGEKAGREVDKALNK